MDLLTDLLARVCPLEKDNLIEATVGGLQDSKKVEDLRETRSKTAPHHLEHMILQDLCSYSDLLGLNGMRQDFSA